MTYKVEIHPEDVSWLLSEVMRRTKTRGEGVALLISVYIIICERFEPTMSRERAAEEAKRAILSATGLGNLDIGGPRTNPGGTFS